MTETLPSEAAPRSAQRDAIIPIEAGVAGVKAVPKKSPVLDSLFFPVANADHPGCTWVVRVASQE